MIEGKNIKIRTVKENDLDEFFRLKDSIRLDPSIFYNELESEYQFKSKFFETGFWEEKQGDVLVVDFDDRILGTIWFSKTLIFDALELGFVVFKEKDRGKGLMKEALALFSAYLFATKKIKRIQLSIPDYHRAAIAVAQKCGFVFEGIARKAVYSKGKYLDICLYSMLRSECKTLDKLF